MKRVCEIEGCGHGRWTTADAGAHLDVTRGNVARTLARQKPPVLPLPQPFKAGRGWSQAYLECEVRRAQLGRGAELRGRHLKERRGLGVC